MDRPPRTDHGPILAWGWNPLISTIILGLGIFFAYQWWKNPLMHRAALIALVVSVIPLALTIFQFLRLRRALGKADLLMDLESVPLGYSGTVTYVRPLRDAEVREMEVRLQCEETVVKGSGKNKREVTEKVYDEVLSPQTTPMMQQLHLRIPIKIPNAGPHSMEYEEAKITWWVRLRLKMRGCPNTRSSFQIYVYPTVVQR